MTRPSPVPMPDRFLFLAPTPPTLAVTDVDDVEVAEALDLPKGVREVVLKKENGQGLGLRLVTDEDNNSTRVVDVVEGGAAAARGGVSNMCFVLAEFHPTLWRV